MANEETFKKATKWRQSRQVNNNFWSDAEAAAFAESLSGGAAAKITECKARTIGPEPTDCDWPVCDCDKRTEEIKKALIDSKWSGQINMTLGSQSKDFCQCAGSQPIGAKKCALCGLRIKAAAPSGGDGAHKCIHITRARLQQLEDMLGHAFNCDICEDLPVFICVDCERLSCEKHEPASGGDGTRASFWVIERFDNDKSGGYWTGESSRGFTPDIGKSVQFHRREDAVCIKRGWHWKDVKVTEHIMLAGGESAPEPPA